MENMETKVVAHDSIDDGDQPIQSTSTGEAASLWERIRLLRPGQWLRIVAVAVAIVGLALYLILPQVIIAYQRYDNLTVGDRVLEEMPLQFISGINNFFGGTSFAFYKNSEYQSVEILTSQVARFNFFALGLFLLVLVACGLTLWLNFTKKHEKWSKLITLFYVVGGLMIIMGPIWFLATNGFGGADYTDGLDVSRYWNYNELYVHDAYGALVAGLVVIAAAVLFGIGTSLEGGKNDARNAA